ncbi:hypothetical protein GCM10023194_07340 [Planotetraspora phitsanulokensis]|uniref:Uncharacterized protein n=1 Tax=Planotetraspora phitsanulokensis TaxID=575192 RepID=A0A8J3XFL3_9ACTN|nr:hypothetical protein [Planotetraspora phitsanulokensis]GII39230.1 hypothetical protein Pph01_42330 [Planotetraspora phitsanulokensis]
MTRTPELQWGTSVPAAVRCAVDAPESGRGDRMARFAAGSRLGPLLVIGGLIAVGWLLGVIFGVFGTATSVAQTALSHVAAGSALSDVLPTADSSGSPAADAYRGSTGSSGDFPTVSDDAPANAAAMAGRTVDGMTSQSKPVLPSPSTADHAPENHGLVPQTGSGSSMFGDLARPVLEPRLTSLPAPLAAVVPPVVRTAADDPSFSPD